MQHPDSDTKLWGHIWFAKYSLTFALPLLLLFIPFRDHALWLAGLALYWACSTAIFAWRSVNENVGLAWRIGLGFVMIGFLSFVLFAALIPKGDTKICFDRMQRMGLWGPLINLGPDPLCDGTPLQDVQID